MLSDCALNGESRPWQLIRYIVCHSDFGARLHDRHIQEAKSVLEKWSLETFQCLNFKPHCQKTNNKTTKANKKHNTVNQLSSNNLKKKKKKSKQQDSRVSQVVLVVKNPPANAGDTGDLSSIPGQGRSPRGGHGNPHQYSCLENPMDRGSWWVKVHRITKHQTRLK